MKRAVRKSKTEYRIRRTILYYSRMSSVTRGYGLLEGWLSRLRSAMAERLIPATLRGGRLLDIGCGQTPMFLLQTIFGERIGIDQHVSAEARELAARRGITLIEQDMEVQRRLPFNDASVDVVTMLAVFEHVKPDDLTLLIREIHRILKPGGTYIVTTPARWTDPILAVMSFLRLVSADEIDEHEEMHTRASLKETIAKGGFRPGDIETGTFECGMNLWARATKLILRGVDPEPSRRAQDDN